MALDEENRMIRNLVYSALVSLCVSVGVLYWVLPEVSPVARPDGRVSLWYA